MSQVGLLRDLHMLLTEDVELQALFEGPVQIYPHQAPRDPGPRYMVHTLRGRHDDLIFGSGQWICDVYDASPVATTAIAISQRIQALVGLAVSKPNCAMLEFVTSDPIPTGNENMQRYTNIFRANWADRTLNQALSQQ